MGSLNEVVTLQLGHYANFIGSHWWNIQESSFVYSPDKEKEINHDVLWREGRNANGDVTYTPRLVAFDLKGSLRTLRQEGVLYEIPEAAENIPWQSDVTLHKTDPASKNSFLQDLEAAEYEEEMEAEADKEECITKEVNQPAKDEPVEYRSKMYYLDDSVQVWSDFLRVHLHPRTVQLVNEYDHNDDDFMSFNVFGYGQSVYKGYDTQREIEDKLHFFLEECDHLQGLQVLLDTYDGFGGLGSSMLEDLTDDYENKTLLSISVTPLAYQNNNIRDQCHRAVNTVLATDSLLSYCSTVLPLSLQGSKYPCLDYKPGLLYHTSAILAANLDCATMPYRLNTDPVPMASMFGALSEAGHKLLGLQSSFPFPIRPGQSLIGSLLESGSKPVWCPITPGCTTGSKPWAQAVHLTGVPLSRLHPSPVSTSDVNERLQQCGTIPEVLQLYLEEVTGSKRNLVTTLNSPLNIQSPFPPVFSPNVSVEGELGVKGRAPGDGVTSAPIMTSLQATPDMQHYLRSILDPVKKFNIKKFHKFLDAGLEEDDYGETLARLENVHDQYIN